LTTGGGSGPDGFSNLSVADQHIFSNKSATIKELETQFAANDTIINNSAISISDAHILSNITSVYAQNSTAVTFNAKEGGSAALYKGQAVYLSGASGSNPLILPADNTVTAKSRVVGLVVYNVAKNGQAR
jgi:hypothetical protein